MSNKTLIQELLQKPLWQLTGEEYVALHTYACSINNSDIEGRQPAVQCKGVNALAEYCKCSPSQIAKLLREGVLESAVVSRIGKCIVFDGDEARRCANEYQEQQREIRRNNKSA